MKLEDAMRLGALRALDAGIERCAKIVKAETVEMEKDGVVAGIRVTAKGELARMTKEDLQQARADIATMKL